MSFTRSQSPRGLVEPRAEQPFETLAGLAASFARRGTHRALVAFRRDGSDTLSYAQLAELIAATAQGLLASGIGRGDRVALLGPNSLEWVVASLGIVTAGAVAVPLDAQATTESLVAAIGRATPKAALTTRAQRDALAPLVGSGVRFWVLDGADDDGVPALRAMRSQTEQPRIGADDVASLLFTSGTTGTPKAVALTHRNLAANAGALLAARLMQVDDRVLLPLPLHHTYPFTVGLLTTLATGATVVFPAGISGPEILQACTGARATALVAVPRLCAAIWDGLESAVRARGALAARAFRALLATSIALRRYTGLRVGRLLFRSIHARFGGTLELIGCGGAKLPTELAWSLEGLGFRVLTGYGLTETSPVLTFNSPRQSLLGSEGRPLPGIELRIAAATSAAPGEILARGPSVFTGYWNDPDVTAQAFTDDGWFRTGDLGRIDERGFLHVVGRSKELIVLADGKKFFPEPIEKIYAQSPLLKEIGVFERDGMLAAVIVPDEDQVRARGALREAGSLREEIESVAARLPPHQRITSYRVVRDELPRTQLGKLRRHLLQSLFDGGEERQRESAPLTEADRALLATPRARDVWRWLGERYKGTPLSLDTSPQLDLSIDSLAWVTLTVDIERQFDVALRAEQLARILTLRDLLREIEAAAGVPGPAHSSPPRFVEPGPALRALGAVLLLAARVLVRLALRPTVKGVEQLPSGPALITPNHASYLDPLVVVAALPWRRLRRTYWAGWVGVMHSSPLRRLVSRATQVFPVDADRDLAGAVRTARQLLEQGYTVVWFPEGRRSGDGELQNFQPGVGVLLEGTAAGVVPTAIKGTFAAWPKHRRWPRPARVEVTFGTPLELKDAESPADIRASLERAVKDLLCAQSETGAASIETDREERPRVDRPM
jgi:long-chain acyl-CoA synthetase